MKPTKYFKDILYNSLKDFFLINVSKLIIPRKDVEIPKEVFTGPYKRISICTTCMDRTMHLKKTYLKNVKHNIEYPNIEFVLLNYGSKDDMDKWVKDNLAPYIDQGILNYYRTDQPEKFHASKARNLTHRLAQGEVIVNVDADNFTGKNFAYYINNCFKDGDSNFYQFTGKDFRYFDTYGRIALLKEHFMKIGGYNEELAPFAGEDTDLMKRLEVMGLNAKVISIVNFLRTVKHDNKLRLKNLSMKSMDEMRKINLEFTNNFVSANKYFVNDQGFTKFKVFKNYSKIAKTV